MIMRHWDVLHKLHSTVCGTWYRSQTCSQTTRKGANQRRRMHDIQTGSLSPVVLVVVVGGGRRQRKTTSDRPDWREDVY